MSYIRLCAINGPAILKIMFFAPVIIAAAPVSAFAQAKAQASAQANDIDRISRHLTATTSMTATFAQTDRNGKSQSGTLTIKRPGKIRFQYQPGVPLLIVGDGKALTFIDYSAKQVSRWPIGQSPLGLLLSPSPKLDGMVRLVPSGDNRIVAAEARDPRRPEFGTLSLAFARDPAAPGGLRLQGWIALDAQNNRTTVRLSNQRFNVAISDQMFQWRDPRPSGPRR